MKEEGYKPKDGGRLAWLTVFGSFLCSGVSMGTINSFGVIYVELFSILEQEKVENAAFKTSLVGSLAFGLVLLLSIASGVLCDQLGVRWTIIIGSVIGNLGLLASSWFTNKVEALLFTYSVVYGIGTGLLLTPTIVILSFHFNKHFGLVCGIAGTGASIFGVIMPAVIHQLLPLIGLSGVFRVLACMLFVSQMLGVATFKVPAEALNILHEKRKENIKWSSVINLENWRNLRYVIWCISVAITSFGFFIPFIHIVSFIIMGILTMLLSVCDTWGALIAVVIGLGIFEGSYMTLLGKITTHLCGVPNMAQGFGFLCGFCAIPATAGPAVAGYLFQETGSYYIPFLVCGSTPVIGGLLMVIIYFIKPAKVTEIPSSSEAKAWQHEL